MVDGDGVDGEEVARDRRERAASPSMLSSRLKAFVIADEPEPAGERRERVVVDHLARSARSTRTIAAGAELDRELDERRQGVGVVDQPADEEERARRRGCPTTPRRVDGAPRGSRPRCRRARPKKMPTPPNHGVS